MAIRVKHTNPNWLTQLMTSLKASEASLEVGIVKENVNVSYPTGERVVDIAVQNEYGIGVPARPAIADSSEALTTQFKKFSSELKIGESVEVLDKFAPVAVGIVQQSITDLRDPPNSKKTIEKKGSSNPLIDSGLYRQSIDAMVREGK